MKKAILFGAKTLAAVALTSLIFTSCDEENFSITPSTPAKPTELPNATATVSATTMDLMNSKELDATYSEKMPYTVVAGADGAIAAQDLKVTSTVEGYLTRTKNISIPAVAKGQSIYIPVVFYTSSIEDMVSFTEPTMGTELTGMEAVSETITEFEAGKSNVIKFDVPEGMKLADYEAIAEAISELTIEDMSRSASENQTLADLKEALTFFIAELKDFDAETLEVELYIPEGTASIKVELTPFINEGTFTFGAEQDGYSVEYTDVKIEEIACIQYTITFIDGEGHSHAGHAGQIGHGHGHGDNNNAGGGSAGE